jgi:hypothetical protein
LAVRASSTGHRYAYWLIPGYLLVIAMTKLAPRFIIPIAFDCGGVTTSTVTVPLVTALGVGLAERTPGRGPDDRRFRSDRLCLTNAHDYCHVLWHHRHLAAEVKETCRGANFMKFSAVVLIVPDEDEDRAVELLKQAGATGITIIKGKGLRHNERKTFLGLGLERKESLLLCVTEQQLAMRILRAVKLQMKLDLPGGGLAFSIALGSVVGIGLEQMKLFRDGVGEGL